MLKLQRGTAKVVCSNVSNSELAFIHLALAVDPRVGITTRLADDTETSGLHATSCAIRANIAVASVALEHSLKGVGGLGLHGVDLVNVALEGLAILQRDHRVGARVFGEGFGVGHDRAARSSAQLTVALVFGIAVELLGVPLVDVVRVTVRIQGTAQLQGRKTPCFA